MQILSRLINGIIVGLICALPWMAAAQTAPVKHAVAMHGQPKYERGFSFFDYVNPNAPKRGTLKQGAIGTYDSFNPYIINGIAPAGMTLVYDTLMKQNADEPFSLYGLIAEGIEMPADRSWVAFHINPKATFADGSKITPEDVIFSFNVLREKGLPTFRYYYNDVEKVEKTSDSRVLFKFKKGAHNLELPLILGELPVLSQKDWEGRDFSKTTTQVPLASGPYVVDTYEMGRSITYKRNPTYWAKDLNVNRGYYNFDKIVFDYYRDATVATEGFKAEMVDIRQENEAKKWAAFAREPDVLSGDIKRVEFKHSMPSGMQGFVYNLRRPIFADRNVREALAYAFDFNWTNANLFYGLYNRTTSYFDNSELKAPPLPDEAELALLRPYKDQLPPEVFTRVYEPPVSQGNMRPNLIKALALLGKSGWHVHKDGILRNSDGQAFTFEILLDSASASAWERVTLPFVGQLKRLGINAKVSIVDVIQYKNRLDSFDYDMIVGVWGQSMSPGNEQRYFWGSESADSNGSANYSGIKNKAVDALIEKVITAKGEQEHKTAVHALDRVLLWHFLVIPHWHTPVTRIVFWDKFGIPKTVPMKGVNPLTWWAK